jgi:hypothetical protein
MLPALVPVQALGGSHGKHCIDPCVVHDGRSRTRVEDEPIIVEFD